MKIKKLFIATILLGLTVSCTENETRQEQVKQSKQELERITNLGELGYYYPYNKMNWNGGYLTGADGNPYKDCDMVPNGWCEGMLVPLSIRTLTDKDVMYIDVIDENLIGISVGVDHGYTIDSIYEDLINSGASQEFAENQSPFILNHFSFNHQTEILGELKDEILSLGNHPDNSNVYIKEGDYEIVISDQYPNGFIKVPIVIE